MMALPPTCQSPNPKVAAASTFSRRSQAQIGASIRRIFSSHLRHSSHAPVWYIAPRHQLLHYSQYRMDTGCHKATSIQHLHDECQALPVKEHLEMQCTQFLANALQTHHPSHGVVSDPPAARLTMKPTLQHCFGHKVSQYMRDDGIISQLTYKRAVKEILTEAVSSYRASHEPNRVLGFPAPDVHPSEASLPRAHRTTLRQLRGWWCKDLRSFHKHIKKTQDENCPECNSSAHTTPHLFACPAAPTTLRPIDLWERPSEEPLFFPPSPPSFTFPL
jgi:hypothetical protein